MNITNMNALIAALEKADPKRFYMGAWQFLDDLAGPENGALNPDYQYAHTPEAFHACGNSACIAGYAALLPEWTQGQVVYEYEEPYLEVSSLELFGSEVLSVPRVVRREFFGSNALSVFLDIPSALAEAIARLHVYGPSELSSSFINSFDELQGWVFERHHQCELGLVTQMVAWGHLEGKLIANLREASLYEDPEIDITPSLEDMWLAMDPEKAVRMLKWLRDHPKAASAKTDLLPGSKGLV